MLLVWVSMIPCVPALIVVVEWIQSKLPEWLRDPPPAIRAGREPRACRRAGLPTRRGVAPWVFLALVAAVTVVAAWKIPAFLRDPWEYNFARLGSRGSAQSGAGEWSNKAEQVFGGKMNVAGALMLADSAEQVPLLEAQILANDAADPRDGSSSPRSRRRTIFCPVRPEEQKAKLEVLDRIRDRLTPAVIDDLPEDERARVEDAEAACEPARPRAEGPPGAPAASLRGERRARRDRLLREVPERRRRSRTGTTCFASRSRRTTCACPTAPSCRRRAARPSSPR